MGLGEITVCDYHGVPLALVQGVNMVEDEETHLFLSPRSTASASLCSCVQSKTESEKEAQGQCR